MAVPQSFPAKIYQILENESPDIIQWNENGVSFRIVDHGRFEREIVPKYFRHNQISSVQRQLNLYGFKCISRGEFKRSFFHPKFRRGDWETVRKLTRFVPVKKNSQLPSDDQSPAGIDLTTNAEERKRDERNVHPTMYNPYFYPIPGANLATGTPDAAYLNRNYMMTNGGPAPNGAWPESWDRQENANNLNARMMGMPAHFAYSMIPMHAAAMQHMNGAVLHGSSSSNLARLDPSRASELSNRLGFKFPPPVPESSASVNGTPSVSSSSSSSVQANTSGASEPSNATLRVQVPDHHQQQSHHSIEDRHPQALAHAHHSNAAGSGNPEYDFMVEFGMFDGMHLPEPANASGAPPLAQLRLPTIAHELSVEDSQSSVSTEDAAQTGSSSSSGESSHAHASLEVDTSSAHHGEDTGDHVKSVTNTATPNIATSCDMGCNTLLTYSKIHDALVYRQIDL